MTFDELGMPPLVDALAKQNITEPELRLARRYAAELGITLARVQLREGRVEPAGCFFAR